MPNNNPSQTTHGKSPNMIAIKKFFGRYFFIFDFFLTVVAHIILLAIVYFIVMPLIIATYVVIYHTVTSLILLVSSVYSYLCYGLCFLMFHCHVTFINVFVAVAMVWFVFTMFLVLNDYDRLLLFTLRNN